ncbi:hypothetical protein [Streptomyces acidiscabies]|uniref:Uncharacterized protein n=1 Tax=Streptomyces acidiscabies TaxID=42234 RepID=A0ABU4LWW2_9ACTN|nr:hypothetical protein [Streptomyces acidiscabies]MDX3019917.1 hypothetical protein [Streptomyces acidiscabies]
MTGPEHYREAERLLAAASASTETTYGGNNPEADRDIAAAQVHATLALAAATALQGTPTGAMPSTDLTAWRIAASGKGGAR